MLVMMKQRKKEGIMMRNKFPLFCGEMNSPLGPLTIIGSSEGVCSLEFGELNEVIEAVRPWLRKHYLTTEVLYNQDLCNPVIKQLEEYFESSRKSFDLKMNLVGTPFQQRVWQKLIEIPYGSTFSYKQVAEMIGAPKAVRAIGNANNKNPLPILIPCHRVVGSNGALVGYGGGLEKKKILLEIEQSLDKVINS
jgi:methylated-DNA-[protein]-cysteine S-methyltransferase